MDNLIGTALQSPTVLVDGGGTTVSGVEAIKQSLSILLLTPVGTRPMLREYGSRCRSAIFEPMDSLALGILSYTIADAIKNWEPRVVYESCSFVRVDTAAIRVTVNFRIKTRTELETITIEVN